MVDELYRAVDGSDAEELEPDGTTTEIEAPDDLATEESEAATSREEPVERSQSAPPKRVNLDELPDFQAWKSKMDTQLAAERRERERLQTQMEQREREAQEAQRKALEQAIEDSSDPDEQRRYVRQLAELQAAESYAAWQKWDAHVRQRVTEEGLSIADFDPRSYSGATGAAQFERDLATKKAAKLQGELETYKRAADPASIEKMVAEKVAKALQGAGMNTVDTASPATPVNAGASWQRDLALLQSGKMPAKEFSKRWGNR